MHSLFLCFNLIFIVTFVHTYIINRLAKNLLKWQQKDIYYRASFYLFPLL